MTTDSQIFKEGRGNFLPKYPNIFNMPKVLKVLFGLFLCTITIILYF